MKLIMKEVSGVGGPGDNAAALCGTEFVGSYLKIGSDNSFLRLKVL